MSINSVNTQQWRQKWELMIDGKHTEEYFHTWHNSKNEAYAFVINYVKSFGDQCPRKYYRPYGPPSEHKNSAHEPVGTFIKHGVITLAPL